MNYLLGKYIAKGVNSPKRYPNKPFLAEEKQSKVIATTNAQRQRYARIRYGGGK